MQTYIRFSNFLLPLYNNDSVAHPSQGHSTRKTGNTRADNQEVDAQRRLLRWDLQGAHKKAADCKNRLLSTLTSIAMLDEEDKDAVHCRWRGFSPDWDVVKLEQRYADVSLWSASSILREGKKKNIKGGVGGNKWRIDFALPTDGSRQPRPTQAAPFLQRHER
jgi:hypothetical protein